MSVGITPVRRTHREPGLRLMSLILAGCVAHGATLPAQPFETLDIAPSVLRGSDQVPPGDVATDQPHGVVLDDQSAPRESWSSGDQHAAAGDFGAGCAPACPSSDPCPTGVCEAPGLFQFLGMLHDRHGACWTGRGDALLLWRNAPASRPLFAANAGGLPAGVVLNSSQLDSPTAGGTRLSLLRKDCGPEIWEIGYLYGGQFFSDQRLPATSGGYLTAPPGIYGNDFPPVNSLDAARVRLVGSIQTAEVNRRWCHGQNVQFLAGFRWLQWYEMATIEDTYGGGTTTQGVDFYQTSCINNLFGGQIGLDSRLWSTASGFRLDGLVKAGAYANEAAQSSAYVNVPSGASPYSNTVLVTNSPAACSFVGEVGLTGVMPISSCWDFRFGYVGLWVTGLAQPTNQLSGQSLAPGALTAGTLSAAGTAIVQGASFGLEGRW